MAKHVPGSPSPAKIATAMKAMLSRFDFIEAGLHDLRPDVFGIHKSKDLDDGGQLSRRYINRVMEVIHLISHIEDDAKRLADRMGKPVKEVIAFVDTTVPVLVIRRAGDTRKHGLGGRAKQRGKVSGNATIANGLIRVQKLASPGVESPDDDCQVIGTHIVDADHGTFVSSTLIELALKSWVKFVKDFLDVDLIEWLGRCYPQKSGPIVHLKDNQANPVPLGATVLFDLPLGMRETLVDDVVRRAQET